VAREKFRGFSAFLSFFYGVLADGFQHPVTTGFALFFVEKEGFVGEAGEEVECFPIFQWVEAADSFGGFESPTTGEDGETVEEGFFGVGEEVVTPIDEGA